MVEVTIKASTSNLVMLIMFTFIFRNEAWRYNPKVFGTHNQRLMKVLFRGFPVGFAAFVVTLGIEQAIGMDWHDPRGLHGHGHGHGDGHH